MYHLLNLVANIKRFTKETPVARATGIKHLFTIHIALRSKYYDAEYEELIKPQLLPAYPIPLSNFQ